MKRLVLSLMIAGFFAILTHGQVTRYWVGGGTAVGNDGSKWSLTSGGPPIGGTINWAANDIAVFDANSGSNIVVIIPVSIADIGKLLITGNQTVTVMPDSGGDRTLQLNTTGSDTFVVHAGSTFIIKGNATNNRNLIIKMLSGTTASIYGTVKVTDDGSGYGELTKATGGTIIFRNGSVYEHNSAQSGCDIPPSTWETNSTCLITGITSYRPGNLDQNFHHFTWNCPNQSGNISLAGDLTTINGNLKILNTNFRVLTFSNTTDCNVTIQGNFEISGNTIFQIAGAGADNNVTVYGNFVQTGGTFTMSDSSGSDVTMIVYGNFSFSGANFILSPYDSNVNLQLLGNFTISGGSFTHHSTGVNGNVKFVGTSQQNFVKTGGTISGKMHFTVQTNAILNLDSYVLGDWGNSTGNFTLESGATLITSHPEGITTSGNSGCVRVSGTRSYSSGANYRFVASGSQATGNGLPSSLTGILTIGSTSANTSLTLTNSPTTINNKFIVVNSSNIVSGTLQYGSTATLEMQGNAPQTTTSGYFPATSGPYHVIINNASGVTLHASRTINGTLTLTSGNFHIGNNNTLTLNGSLSISGGNQLVGGSLSNLTISGTAGSIGIPAITLNNFTLNRSAGAVLQGNMTIHGTLYMTNGTLTSTSYAVNYQSGANLVYNASSTQNMSSVEFPAINQPSAIYIQNPSTVNIAANRSYGGTIYLQNGTFHLGNYTLTLTGFFQQSAGTIVSSTSGVLLISENTSPTILPSSTSLYTVNIDRSGGVNMNGNTTILTNLQLTNGTLNIGSNQLTLAGAITISSGTLVGGNQSTIVFTGTGAATTLPAITLKDLVINRPNGINLGGNVTVKNQLTLTNGALQIGNNTLFIDGSISFTNGSLGGANSTLQINESQDKSPTILPLAELGTLNITRAAGVTMMGNVTVHQAVNLYSGPFQIGSYTLTINGSLTQNTGTLVGSSFSSLIIGGTGNILEHSVTTLNNLTLSRPNGMKLLSNLTIYGTFTFYPSYIDLNGYTLSYGPNATLRYTGLSSQLVSNAEWPDSNGPGIVVIENSYGVYLTADKTVEKLLNISVGNFFIQCNTLTLNGGLVINYPFGALVGGSCSNLIIGPSLLMSPLNLPSITLNNLTINRPGTTVTMNGDVLLYGTLTLTDGFFNIGSYKLTLYNPVSGNHNNLQSTSLSSLELSGSSDGMNIGPNENIRLSELKDLTITNTHPSGISLNGNLQLSGMLNIQGVEKFRVKPGKWLTIQGNLNMANNYGLTLESIQEATASLLLSGQQFPPDKKIKSERYIKGYTSNTNGWHLLSLPVQSYPIPGSSFEPGPTDDLFRYDEVQNIWRNYKQGHFNTFEAGLGYLIAFDEDDTKWLAAPLFKGSVTFTNLSFTDNRGWHLLGNPYPCGLIWSTSDWQLHNVDAIAKLWDESIHNYIDLEPLGIIPQHNGFFIRVNNPINKIIIPQQARTHTNINWYKNTSYPRLTLKAQSLDNNTATLCNIRLHPEATNGYDHLYDSYYLSGFTQPPVFYALGENDIKLSTHSLPPAEEITIQLYFKKGLSTSYQLQASGLDSFIQGERIYLIDEKLQITTDLCTNPVYSFVSAPNDNPLRFKLLITQNTGINPPPSTSKIQVACEAGRLLILASGYPEGTPLHVELFDLSGRGLFQSGTVQSGEWFSHPITNRGMYLIRITAENHPETISRLISIF